MRIGGGQRGTAITAYFKGRRSSMAKRRGLSVMKFLASCLAAFLLAFLLSATSALATDLKPSRDNFFSEILYAKATSVTPLYNDYTVGSYHANKIGLLKVLPEVPTKEC